MHFHLAPRFIVRDLYSQISCTYNNVEVTPRNGVTLRLYCDANFFLKHVWTSCLLNYKYIIQLRNIGSLSPGTVFKYSEKLSPRKVQNNVYTQINIAHLFQIYSSILKWLHALKGTSLCNHRDSDTFREQNTRSVVPTHFFWLCNWNKNIFRTSYTIVYLKK